MAAGLALGTVTTVVEPVTTLPPSTTDAPPSTSTTVAPSTTPPLPDDPSAADIPDGQCADIAPGAAGELRGYLEGLRASGRLHRVLVSEGYRAVAIVTKEAYRARVEAACEFLDGRSREWLASLREEMAAAEIVAPRLTRLLRVVGREGEPVHDLRFEGLVFAHTEWQLVYMI